MCGSSIYVLLVSMSYDADVMLKVLPSSCDVRCHWRSASSQNSFCFICLIFFVVLFFLVGVFVLSYPVRLANNYRSRKQDRIFQRFGRLFLSGALKNAPCCLNKLLVNFREESSEIGRFCKFEFQRMAN